MRRNFSLVACYLLKFIFCLLLVVKSLVTRGKIRQLLVAEVACCKKSLVSRCRSCSLQKVTRYSLQKLLVAKNHSLPVAKFARCSMQKWSHFLQLYEKVSPAQVFSCDFLRNFKNIYSVEHLQTAASENNIKRHQTFYSFLR